MINDEKHIVPIELLTKVLANEANTEERAMIDKWRNSSVANSKEYDAFIKLWNASNNITSSDSINIDSEWARMENIIHSTTQKSFSIKPVLQIAAAVIFLISASVFGLKQSQTIAHKSDNIALNDITLPDGSTISINAESKISYNKGFGKTNRDVHLKGEGYFEVTKNTELPFVVSANEAKIEVVGTRFNIKAYKNQTEVKVTVTEGKVLFAEKDSPQKNIYLSAGETGTFIRERKEISKEPEIDLNDISWKTKTLSFNNTPLSEVAKVLTNTYNIEIITSNIVGDCSITVTFEDEDLASVLKVLKSTLDITIRKDGDKLFISGERCFD